MTEVQKLAKVMVLKDMCKEYELLAKYNGGVDYDRWKALEMLIKALSQEPKWIPVSDRLPEENGYYLTTTMYHAVCFDYWGGECFDRTEEIIAWMPLPKPYEPQESEG